MKRLLPIIALSLTVGIMGCDESLPSGSTSPVNTPLSNPSTQPNRPNEVDVDVNLNQPNELPLSERLDRREERRENLRDVIDGVDVNVNGGQTKVDIK